MKYIIYIMLLILLCSFTYAPASSINWLSVAQGNSLYCKVADGCGGNASTINASWNNTDVHFIDLKVNGTPIFNIDTTEDFEIKNNLDNATFLKFDNSNTNEVPNGRITAYRGGDSVTSWGATTAEGGYWNANTRLHLMVAGVTRFTCTADYCYIPWSGSQTVLRTDGTMKSTNATFENVTANYITGYNTTTNKLNLGGSEITSWDEINGTDTYNSTADIRAAQNYWNDTDIAARLVNSSILNTSEIQLGRVTLLPSASSTPPEITLAGSGSHTLTMHGDLTVSGTSTINQNVGINSNPTFYNPRIYGLNYTVTTVDYWMTHRSNLYIAWQNQKSGQQFSFEGYNKDGDSSDNINMILWAKGLPASVTNREFTQWGFITGSNYFKVNTDAAGTGTVRPLYLYAGSSNSHIQLLANGDVSMPDVYSDTVGATNRDLYIDNTGKIGYVSSSITTKENIRNITDSERIYSLNPVLYDSSINEGKNLTGLIAEEVVDIMPELVSYRQVPVYDYRDSGLGKDEKNKTIMELYIREYTTTDEPETVKYSDLLIPMLKEIQRLNEKVEDLEQRINELTK